MSRGSRQMFLAIAAIFVGGAVYHALALVNPAFNQWAYPPTYPAWRHVVFIGINLTFAVLFVRRPRWLVWLHALLTVQILSGHGVEAWRAWGDRGDIEWIHLATVIFSLAVLGFLVADRRRRT